MASSFSAAIITEDCPSLAPFNPKRGGSKKSTPISSDPAITSVLAANGLPIPSNDLAKESSYQSILEPFVRSAGDAFAGAFGEVKLFSERLGQQMRTDLYIISYRYGLVSENESVVPYESRLRTTRDYLELDKRSGFSARILERCQDYSHVLFFIPLSLGEYLASIGLLQELSRHHTVILASSIKLKELLPRDTNIVILPRKGLARIGKKNQVELRKLLAITAPASEGGHTFIKGH